MRHTWIRFYIWQPSSKKVRGAETKGRKPDEVFIGHIILIHYMQRIWYFMTVCGPLTFPKNHLHMSFFIVNLKSHQSINCFQGEWPRLPNPVSRFRSFGSQAFRWKLEPDIARFDLHCNLAACEYLPGIKHEKHRIHDGGESFLAHSWRVVDHACHILSPARLGFDWALLSH